MGDQQDTNEMLNAVYAANEMLERRTGLDSSGPCPTCAVFLLTDGNGKRAYVYADGEEHCFYAPTWRLAIAKAIAFIAGMDKEEI